MNSQIMLLEEELKKKLTPDPNIGETNLFTGISVLYSLRYYKTNKIGVGMAQILQNNQNKRCRLLIRDKHNLNEPIFNGFIYPFSELINYESKKSTFQFESVNSINGVNERNTFLITFVNEDAKIEFLKKYLEAFTINKRLLQQ